MGKEPVFTHWIQWANIWKIISLFFHRPIDAHTMADTHNNNGRSKWLFPLYWSLCFPSSYHQYMTGRINYFDYYTFWGPAWHVNEGEGDWSEENMFTRYESCFFKVNVGNPLPKLYHMWRLESITKIWKQLPTSGFNSLSQFPWSAMAGSVNVESKSEV